MHAPLPALARTEDAPHRSHVNPSTLPQSSESAAPTSAAAMELLRSLDPPADLPEPNLSENAVQVLERRYLKKDAATGMP